MSRSRSSRICAWIVTSSAVVGSSAIREARPADQRHCDHHPLAQPAGEFVGILIHAPLRRADADKLKHLDGARAGIGAAGVAVQPECFDHLETHRVGRVETGHRFLEDHADAVAPDRAHPGFVQADKGRAFERYLTGVDPAHVRRQQLHDRHRGHAFPAAALADQPDDFAGLHVEPDMFDDRNASAFGREADRQILNTQQWHGRSPNPGGEARAGRLGPARRFSRKRSGGNRERPPSSADPRSR